MTEKERLDGYNIFSNTYKLLIRCARMTIFNCFEYLSNNNNNNNMFQMIDQNNNIAKYI